jgi:uncharacterized membrane protein YedE/YeeE
MKAWLKGGLIGISIYFILLIIIAIGDNFINLNPLMRILMPTWNYLLPSAIWNILMVYIISPIIYFFIGAIIGWIVGKIKSKKQQTINP